MDIKLTKNRQAILDLLTAHHGTMTAADIHAALPEMDLVTIYRTLDLFTKAKVIKQFHLSGGEAQYEHQTKPHHHAVCDDCHKVLHFEAPDAQIKRLLQLKGFAIDDIELTIKGSCHSHA